MADRPIPKPRVPRRMVDRPSVQLIRRVDLSIFTNKLLGNGSYGEVYQGRWNNRDVAVKMFFQKQIGQQSRPNTIDRERERDTLSRVHNHLNVINLYGVGDDGVKQFIVMELAPLSMDRVLHGTGPPHYEYYADHVIGWGLQIATALEFIHSQDIIHRDIKPSKLLLFDETRLLKLCDFGKAKVLKQPTESGSLVGTAYYIAPEVMHSVATRQSDIFSFAITFWEMITRHKPCLEMDSDNQPHSYAIMMRMDGGDRPPLIKGIPRFFSELLVKCWDRDPEKRLTSHQLAEKLHLASRYFKPNLPIVDLSKPTPHSVNPDDAKKSLGVAVTMEITNVGTQGYPGIGKTSVLGLAMGKEPAPTRTSTDCVDPPSRYLMIDNTDSVGIKWKNVTTEKMFEMVCEAMKKTIDENLSEPNKPTVIASQSTSDTEQATLIATEQISPANGYIQTPDLDFYSTVDPSPGVLLDSSPNSSTQPFPDPAHSSFTVFPELLKELSTSESSDVIFNSHWMMVTDCGGQPPFLDAAALFLRNSCLQIFPVKLNEPLSKTPKFTYFNEGVCASFDEDCVPLTHKQIIETLAKSVASIQPPYTPSATKCPKGAKFTIVGTFEDKAHKCTETVEEKESILKEVLAPYESFRVRLDKKVILPVNAIAIDTEFKKERTESAKKLRRLFKKANVSMKVDVKLRWFGLLLSLLTIAEKENKAVLTLAESYQLGGTLGMDKLETEEAIQFFHDISLIMHFDTPKLRDSVIIDTKPVLKKLSRLISVSFLDEQFLADHYDIVLPSVAKELLQYHGRFSKDTLEKCVEFNELVTLQFFLDILEHVKIAVAIDKESEYFVPCALSYAPEASLSHSSPPWVIRLRVRRGVDKEYIPIPVGYLPAVVVFLLTKFLSHFSTDRYQRQYRNKIVLEYEHGGFISLVERHLQLEIHYSGLEHFPQECTTIRNHVLESIHLTEKKLHIIQEGEGAITKVDSFLCFCGKGSAHHFCTYKPSGCVECEETRLLCDLEPQHLLWLGNKSPTLSAAASETVSESHHTNTASDTAQQEQSTAKDKSSIYPQEPVLRDLMSYVARKTPTKWYGIGIELEIDPWTLDAFEEQTKYHTRLYTKVFEQWRREQKVPYNWTTIIDALEVVEERAVANDIRKWLRGHTRT